MEVAMVEEMEIHSHLNTERIATLSSVPVYNASDKLRKARTVHEDEDV